mgnify:CR=1 FL=1
MKKRFGTLKRDKNPGINLKASQVLVGFERISSESSSESVELSPVGLEAEGLRNILRRVLDLYNLDTSNQNSLIMTLEEFCQQQEEVGEQRKQETLKDIAHLCTSHAQFLESSISPVIKLQTAIRLIILFLLRNPNMY